MSSTRKPAPTSAEAALAPTAFQELPLGAVEPRGWLYHQLRLQADGLTGHLEEIWPDVGPQSAWLGGDGEDWERGPYYCDGLIPLAYLLRDAALLARARRWIESVLASQRADGQFGPTTNDDWWPRMVMLKALAQYHDATSDPRVLPFMLRYCRYQHTHLPERPLRDWGRARGADNVLTVYWLFERTGDESLLDLADLILTQTEEWGPYIAHALPHEKVMTFDHRTHVVNVAMGLKTPATQYLRDGRADRLPTIDAAVAALMRYHGQVQGIFSGDEWLAGLSPTQGVELCAVVEYMFSLETIVRVFGEGRYADTLEVVAYNALAATITADMRAHQYDQQPNQVLCTVAPRVWTQNDETSNTFGLEPHFGCCTANMHQGWPKLTRALWMATPDKGLAAVVYAPCLVRARVADADVVVDETTDYPFDGTVRFTIHTAVPASFPLRLRVPQWCHQPVVAVNGEECADLRRDRGFVTLRRVWREGDEIELVMPMRLRTIDRPGGAVGVARGPLVFALNIGEEWVRIPGSRGFGDWEVRPTTPWNYALSWPPHDPTGTTRVEWVGVGTPPFGHDVPPVRIHAHGYRVPEWGLADNSAGPIPTRPIRVTGPREPVTLIPYGCARLRIAEFPVVTPP